MIRERRISEDLELDYGVPVGSQQRHHHHHHHHPQSFVPSSVGDDEDDVIGLDMRRLDLHMPVAKSKTRMGYGVGEGYTDRRPPALDLEKIRKKSMSPDTIVQAPLSPAPTMTTMTTSNFSDDSSSITSPRTPGSALSRFFKPKKNGSGLLSPPTPNSPGSGKGPRFAKSMETLNSVSTNSSSSSSTLDPKDAKAEEKRRKKELARIRTERLAQDLKDRAKSRAEALAEQQKKMQMQKKADRALALEASDGLWSGMQFTTMQ